ALSRRAPVRRDREVNGPFGKCDSQIVCARVGTVTARMGRFFVSDPDPTLDDEQIASWLASLEQDLVAGRDSLRSNRFNAGPLLQARLEKVYGGLKLIRQ